jgi:hypothetical protein
MRGLVRIIFFALCKNRRNKALHLSVILICFIMIDELNRYIILKLNSSEYSYSYYAVQHAINAILRDLHNENINFKRMSH